MVVESSAALDKQTAVMPEEALNEREETRLGTSHNDANGGLHIPAIHLENGDSAHESKGTIELAAQPVIWPLPPLDLTFCKLTVSDLQMQAMFLILVRRAGVCCHGQAI